MTPDQLDEFQAWLSEQADKASKDFESYPGSYFSGRICAFRDAFEYLAIKRMQPNQPSPNHDT